MRHSPARILLIRHGETDWNAAGRIQGHLPIPLNTRGRAQARAVAELLAAIPFDALYSSDLLRALETAEAIGARCRHTLCADARLREWDLGVLAGLTRTEAARLHPEVYSIIRERTVDRPIPGGESIRRRAARMFAAIEKIAARHPGGTAVVVSHGGTLGDCYRRGAGLDLADKGHIDLHNAGLNGIQVSGETWSVESWGATSHLTDIGALASWEGSIRG